MMHILAQTLKVNGALTHAMSMNGQCYHFMNGQCRYGSACRFSHAVHHSDRQSSQRRHSDRSRVPPRRPAADNEVVSSDGREWSRSEACYKRVSESIWSLRLMSYNVLADALAFEHARDLYSNVPRNLLRFNIRIAQIVNEVQRLLPDILSLQEVDRPVDFVHSFEKLGYQYHYVERTGDKTDGCACFWNAAKLRCRDSKMINFSNIGLRDNVAQILVLEDAESEGQLVVIANTHILFNPKRGDIKVAQIRIILEAVHDMRQQYGGSIPCMFMGDLNLTPDSALYSFIATGEMDCLTQDPRNMSGQQESRSARRASNSSRRSPYTPQAARRQGLPLPPPMQPTYQHASAEQAVRPTHTRFGMEALEDMINMGRAMSGSLAPAASQPHAHVPAAHAATVHQQPPAQRSYPMTAASQPSHGRISVTESKKIKLDSDGLVAFGTSTAETVTGQQPAAAPRQQQGSGHASTPELSHWGPGLHGQGLDSHPHRPSGDVMAGLRLQVEDDRTRVIPSLLNSSASAGATPSPQYQGSTGRAPLWGSPMLSHDSCSWAPHSSSPQQTPHSAPATARRFSSGRGQVGMDLEQLTIAHTREVFDPNMILEPILQHPLQLQSAYMEVTGAEPDFTSTHNRFHGTVDYIWYTPEAGNVLVVPSTVLDPPPEYAVSRGLPTAQFPSDHICIVCDFDLLYNASALA